jgi:hypothetical protein
MAVRRGFLSDLFSSLRAAVTPVKPPTAAGAAAAATASPTSAPAAPARAAAAAPPVDAKIAKQRELTLWQLEWVCELSGRP